MEEFKEELVVLFIEGVARELLNRVTDQLGTHIQERFTRMEFEKFLGGYGKESLETRGVREGKKRKELRDHWR
jgi:hypothetical protein